jgi:hypothetical protein
MINIPIGKALVAVEQDDAYCKDCIIPKLQEDYKPNCHFACSPRKRADGKDVIFKLVDWIKAEEFYHEQT